MRLSNLIVDAFPMEENSTYYIPALKNDQAQGKLHTQYNNYKASLRTAGLCRKRQYVPKRNGKPCFIMFRDSTINSNKFKLKEYVPQKRLKSHIKAMK